MRIEIRGRNVEMTDDLREMVRKRFQRLGRQVSALATLEVVLSEERNPSISDSQVAEATFRLKGVTLHAREASPEMAHTVHELAEDLRRQVKKHRELLPQAQDDAACHGPDARQAGDVDRTSADQPPRASSWRPSRAGGPSVRLRRGGWRLGAEGLSNRPTLGRERVGASTTEVVGLSRVAWKVTSRAFRVPSPRFVRLPRRGSSAASCT